MCPSCDSGQVAVSRLVSKSDNVRVLRKWNNTRELSDRQSGDFICKVSFTLHCVFSSDFWRKDLYFETAIMFFRTKSCIDKTRFELDGLASKDLKKYIFFIKGSQFYLIKRIISESHISLCNMSIKIASHRLASPGTQSFCNCEKIAY